MCDRRLTIRAWPVRWVEDLRGGRRLVEYMHVYCLFFSFCTGCTRSIHPNVKGREATQSLLRARTTRMTLHSTLFRSRGLACLVASSSKPILLSLKRKRERERKRGFAPSSL
ncbi:unnamed protein product [Trichogramma brassicae]|uniref:Uncharacterized protein n=1 Tax=Trichogramma brassicae TaxID=86971 RepID=A0A6H5IIK9_9HYME|nr:unnamed protein product [Trichogramma brassicae]